jgi:hypothetical protein
MAAVSLPALDPLEPTAPASAAAGAPAHPDPAVTKRALEGLLRERRLQRDAPPLRGEDRRLRPLTTGLSELDALLDGGLPRGQLSQWHGPASSGRTGILLSLVAEVTRRGALAALVDPLDALDPGSAAAAGADLARLLWLRGPRTAGEEVTLPALANATAAVATLAGSGLFDLVALDLAGTGPIPRALPSTTWLRLYRLVEGTPTALVVVADHPIGGNPGGASLALEPQAVRWSGPPGPSRLLHTLVVRAHVGRHGRSTVAIELPVPA